MSHLSGLIRLRYTRFTAGYPLAAIHTYLLSMVHHTRDRELRGQMAKPKRSKKAGSPPPSPRSIKQPKAASRTESAPDVRVKLGLSRSRAKGIAAHIRSSGKRRQAQRDAR